MAMRRGRDGLRCYLTLDMIRRLPADVEIFVCMDRSERRSGHYLVSQWFAGHAESRRRLRAAIRKVCEGGHNDGYASVRD